MKDKLYWLLSASSFIQAGKSQVFGISNFFVAISIASLIAAIPIGLGLDYGQSFPYLLPFIVLGLMMVLNKLIVGIVPEDIQDKHWRTQLVRFKDPKYFLQKQLYPNSARRELQLERMWFAEYGVEFDNTIAPWYQKARIVLLPLLAVIGLLIGMIL